MMPGTITDRRVEPVTVEVTAVTDVSALTGAERAVALYVSDMPNGRRRHTREQVRAWIAQGAERLGSELRRHAEYRCGHRRLEMSKAVPVQVQARHEQRFPNARRLDLADRTASGSVLFDGMTEEARARNGRAAVDGECPCRGTGQIPFRWVEYEAGWSQVCPVHRSGEIETHRAQTFRARFGEGV